MADVSKYMHLHRSRYRPYAKIERRMMVVRLLREGYQAFEIAQILGCSTATVCADVKFFSTRCTQELVRNLKEKQNENSNGSETRSRDGNGGNKSRHGLNPAST